MSTVSPLTDHYVQARFFDDTSEHKLQVLHNHGIYRHLRFKKLNTNIYYFDLVTWPGHLAITGDAGNYVFARTPDMFEFFTLKGADLRINPQYWSEKLVAPRGPDGVLVFSRDKYKQRVIEWAKDLPTQTHVRDWLSTEDQHELNEAVNDRLLFDPHDIHEAMKTLTDFECHGIRIDDAWEWDLREYRFDFLWCCWAIVWGISMYERFNRGE